MTVVLDLSAQVPTQPAPFAGGDPTLAFYFARDTTRLKRFVAPDGTHVVVLPASGDPVVEAARWRLAEPELVAFLAEEFPYLARVFVALDTYVAVDGADPVEAAPVVQRLRRHLRTAYAFLGGVAVTAVLDVLGHVNVW